jgi:hypothetical protein
LAFAPPLRGRAIFQSLSQFMVQCNKILLVLIDIKVEAAGKNELFLL